MHGKVFSTISWKSKTFLFKKGRNWILTCAKLLRLLFLQYIYMLEQQQSVNIYVLCVFISISLLFNQLFSVSNINIMLLKHYFAKLIAFLINFQKKHLSVCAVMFCNNFLAYTMHIDRSAIWHEVTSVLHVLIIDKSIGSIEYHEAVKFSLQ